MRYSVTKLLKNAVTAIELAYRVVRGIDYETLSRYILKINQQKNIDAILYEVSRCLKEILDYELFGFALKNGNSIDLWIDPRVYSVQLVDYVAHEFGSQNIGFAVRYFEKKTGDDSHNYDAVGIDNLISYKVIDGDYIARLYIQPKKKMPYYQDNIVSTIIGSISTALEKSLSIKQLENAATIDPLTNCYNRRALDRFIENDIAYARRNGEDLSIVIVDLDDFKEINDIHGHLAGDAVLQEISTLVRSIVRKSDYLARYGGEEFVMVLPDTSLYQAVQLSEKLQKRIAGHAINLGDKSIMITASFGVASLENKPDAGSLFREADERLYKAKSVGKNNVVPSLLPCFADRRFVSRTKEDTRKYAASAQMA